METLSPAELQSIRTQGMTFYEHQLKAVLEPQENGRMVAVHLASGDYAVEDTYPRALRLLRARQPQGMTAVLRVGAS